MRARVHTPRSDEDISIFIDTVTRGKRRRVPFYAEMTVLWDKDESALLNAALTPGEFRDLLRYDE